MGERAIALAGVEMGGQARCGSPSSIQSGSPSPRAFPARSIARTGTDAERRSMNCTRTANAVGSIPRFCTLVRTTGRRTSGSAAHQTMPGLIAEMTGCTRNYQQWVFRTGGFRYAHAIGHALRGADDPADAGVHRGNADEGSETADVIPALAGGCWRTPPARRFPPCGRGSPQNTARAVGVAGRYVGDVRTFFFRRKRRRTRRERRRRRHCAHRSGRRSASASPAPTDAKPRGDPAMAPASGGSCPPMRRWPTSTPAARRRPRFCCLAPAFRRKANPNPTRARSEAHLRPP